MTVRVEQTVDLEPVLGERIRRVQKRYMRYSAAMKMVALFTILGAISTLVMLVRGSQFAPIGVALVVLGFAGASVVRLAHRVGEDALERGLVEEAVRTVNKNQDLYRFHYEEMFGAYQGRGVLQKFHRGVKNRNGRSVKQTVEYCWSWGNMFTIITKTPDTAPQAHTTTR